MGAVDHGAFRSVVMAACVALSSAACDMEPCEPLDLRAPESTAAKPDTAVVAISNDRDIDIVRNCATDDCANLSYNINKTGDGMFANTSPSSIEQLMLTASGRWLVYRHEDKVHRVDLDACPGRNPSSTCFDDLAHEVQPYDNEEVNVLHGTLRSGDWLLYKTLYQELGAVYVGDEREDDPGMRIGDGLERAAIVAVGHRHVVLRERLGDGKESLYLVRIAPELAVHDPDDPDDPPDHALGEALHLVTGETFRRVLLTEGPSPAELGGADTFLANVRTDNLVIATSGEGSGARTLTYAVADLRLRASFPGEVVTNHIALEDVPGLSAVSPDGTHLAYIRDGDLVMRDLETHETCLVRAATRSNHVLAGFAADATLFFETEHHDATLTSVDVFNPIDGVFTRLTSAAAGTWTIRAVPQLADANEPWAIVTGPDSDVVARPNDQSQITLDKDVRFLPRDGDMWTISVDAETTNLDVQVLEPKPNKNNIHCADGSNEACLATIDYGAHASAKTCVSTSHATSRTTPWARLCPNAANVEQALDFGLPEDDPTVP